MIARRLAEWATGPLDIPDQIGAAARRHLLDGLGTALGALRTRAAEAAVAVARGLAGPPESAILGDRQLIGTPAAALANGTLVHALDFDDTHAGGLIHATAVVLPAALAVGQQTGASGAAVLEAVVVGYETACRITAAAPNGFHARGLHATMIGGVFSAAIVTARLLGLDADRATAALGIAGSQAGGLLAFLGTGASTKQLHPGFASQSGILAARLAAAGASGPGTVFDGPHGIFDALAAGPADLPSITAGLGSRWETAAIGIKPYPACQLSHASVDAVRDAMARGGFGAADVAEVIATVHPDSAAVVCDDSRDLSRPSTPYAAKFSLPWTVAAVLYDGGLTLDTFSEASLTRPELSDLARRVRWTPLSAPATVAADAPGRVLVRLRDGREHTGTVPRSRGGGDLPLSDRDVLAKFHGNAGGDPTLADAVVEALDDVAAHDGLARLLESVARVVDQYHTDRPPTDPARASSPVQAGPDLETQP